MQDRAAHAQWGGTLVVDAGDALSALPVVPSSRREVTVATAEFIVDQYSASGMVAMALGDRDLALGREALAALAARAKFPLLAANLVDASTDRPVFGDRVVVVRGGLRIGLVGLVSPSGAVGTLQPVQPDPPPPSWKVIDPVPVARAAAAAFAAEGVDLMVALSHLSPEEEAAVAAAVPSIRLYLGGQTMASRPGTGRSGDAVSVLAGMKGKQVGFLTVRLGAGRATNAPLVDAARGRGAADRASRAKVRIEALERRLETARAAAASAEAGSAASPEADVRPSDAPRRRLAQPVGVWEQQLAAARAELQLAEADAQDGAAVGGASNTVTYELVNLGNDVVDDPTVKAAVDAFRQRYPDPTKVHQPATPPPTGAETPTPPGATAPGRGTLPTRRLPGVRTKGAPSLRSLPSPPGP